MLRQPQQPPAQGRPMLQQPQGNPKEMLIKASQQLLSMEDRAIPEVYNSMVKPALMNTPVGSSLPASVDRQTLEALVRSEGLEPAKPPALDMNNSFAMNEDPDSLTVSDSDDGYGMIADYLGQGEEEDEPQTAEDRMAMTPAVRTELQKDLVNAKETIAAIEDVIEIFDPKLFGLKEEVGDVVGQTVDYLTSGEGTPPYLKDLVERRRPLTENIKKMFSLWRKMITGASAAVEELKDLEGATLNMNLTPTQAQASLHNAYASVIRDAEVKMKLLQEGITPKSVTEARYSELFMDERARVEQDLNKYIDDFIKINKAQHPNVSKLDAIRMRIYEKNMSPGDRARQAATPPPGAY